MTNEFSTQVRFDDHEFVRSHGKAPRFSQNACGWAFKVYEWDGGKEIIWTRGRTAAEVKAEICAKVQAPKGHIFYATFQP